MANKTIYGEFVKAKNSYTESIMNKQGYFREPFSNYFWMCYLDTDVFNVEEHFAPNGCRYLVAEVKQN